MSILAIAKSMNKVVLTKMKHSISIDSLSSQDSGPDDSQERDRNRLKRSHSHSVSEEDLEDDQHRRRVCRKLLDNCNFLASAVQQLSDHHHDCDKGFARRDDEEIGKKEDDDDDEAIRDSLSLFIADMPLPAEAADLLPSTVTAPFNPVELQSFLHDSDDDNFWDTVFSMEKES
eukprot:scaffold1829_cov194-Ochromonas_danica.AAC.9